MSLESPSKESILLSTAEKGKGATGEIRPLVKLTGEKTLFEGDEKALGGLPLGQMRLDQWIGLIEVSRVVLREKILNIID